MLSRHLSLLCALAARDLKDRYRGSVLPGWSLVVPLFLTAVYVGLFGAIFHVRFPGKGAADGFWLPVFCGVLPWIQVHEALRRAPGILVENGALLRNVRLPAELLPLCLVVSSILVQAVLLLIALPWLAGSAGWKGLAGVLWLLPLQVLFSAGVALLLCGFHVYIRDLGPLVSLVLPAWFYVTPILYPWERVPAWLQPWYGANPLAPLVRMYQDLLWRGVEPRWQDWTLFAAWALAAAAAGILVFRRLKPNFADEV